MLKLAWIKVFTSALQNTWTERRKKGFFCRVPWKDRIFLSKRERSDFCEFVPQTYKRYPVSVHDGFRFCCRFRIGKCRGRTNGNLRSGNYRRKCHSALLELVIQQYQSQSGGNRCSRLYRRTDFPCSATEGLQV